jgi:hypothetical protein
MHAGCRVTSSLKFCEPSSSFHLTHFSVSNVWLTILFALLAAGLAYWTYSKTPMVPLRKIFFIALRSTAIFLMLLLFVEPALTRIQKSYDKPKLAVLMDNSESLRITDKTIARDSLLKKTLRDNEAALKEKTSPVFFAFGEALSSPATGTDSLTFSAKRTNIAAALGALRKNQSREKFNAVLMLSDGQFNEGEHPQYESEKSSIPVYSVLIGDTTEKKDISVRRIVAPESMTLGTKAAVSVSFTQQGFTGAAIDVLMSSNGETLSRKTITLNAADETVTFELEPKDIGETSFRISVPPLTGEFSTKNNAQTFFVKVLKNKKKILVISGLADPEISAVRGALSQEGAGQGNLQSVFFTQKTPTDFFEGTLNLAAHQDADACILIGFPNTSVSESIVQQVAAFLNSKPIPVLTLVGLQSSGARLKLYENLLAVSVNRPNAVDALDNTAFIASTPAAKSFPAFKNFSAYESGVKSAAPMSYIDFNFAPKPNASVLWKLLVGSRATEKPLLVTAESSKRKLATLCGSQFWHLSLSPDESVRALYAQTLLGTLDWLMADGDAKRFVAAPVQKVFDNGERVAFTATLQDELLKPVSSAQVSLSIKEKKSGQIFTAPFEPAADAGLYNASFDALPQGEFSFTATAKEGEKLLGTSSGIFSVSETGAEFRQTAANATVMRSIAERSGGKFYLAGDFASLLADLEKEPAFEPVESETRDTTEFANLSTMLAVIVALFAAEWLLRKLSALP